MCVYYISLNIIYIQNHVPAIKKDMVIIKCLKYK